MGKKKVENLPTKKVSLIPPKVIIPPDADDKTKAQYLAFAEKHNLETLEVDIKKLKPPTKKKAVDDRRR